MAEIVVLAARAPLAHRSKRGTRGESSRPRRGSPWQGKSWRWVTPFRNAHPRSSPGLALALGANFQELLAAWESLGRLHVSSLLRSLSSTAELPLHSLSILDSVTQTWPAALQHTVHSQAGSPHHGDSLPALLGAGRISRGPCSTWASEAAEGTAGWERAWAGTSGLSGPEHWQKLLRRITVTPPLTTAVCTGRAYGRWVGAVCLCRGTGQHSRRASVAVHKHTHACFAAPPSMHLCGRGPIGARLPGCSHAQPWLVSAP